MAIFDMVLSMRGFPADFTLKSIANNAEIDVIWDEYQAKLTLTPATQPDSEDKMGRLGDSPRGQRKVVQAKDIHAEWWKQRIARQQQYCCSADKLSISTTTKTTRRFVSPGRSR